MKIENNQLIILGLSNENIIEEDTLSINISDDFTFNDNREIDYKKIVMKSENETEIVRKHGKIVKKLKALLEERGHKVANNNNCDLITYENNIVKSIFEIKTGNDIQTLATSIGQLILYSSCYDNEMKLYIVLPMKISDKILQKLKTNYINVITFNINEKTSEISFDNLPDRFSMEN
jgi:hypothetical protein